MAGLKSLSFVTYMAMTLSYLLLFINEGSTSQFALGARKVQQGVAFLVIDIELCTAVEKHASGSNRLVFVCEMEWAVSFCCLQIDIGPGVYKKQCGGFVAFDQGTCKRSVPLLCPRIYV